MPPLAVSALKAIDAAGPSLAQRLSPAPGTSGAPSAPRGAANTPPRQHNRAAPNGIAVRGAAGGGGHPTRRPHKKYEKDEKVEVANRAADDFMNVFYMNMDLYTRNEELYKLYRPNSVLVWNGNRIQGVDAIKEFFAKLPPSKHDIQSYDCHPVPGSDVDGRKPTLMISVSGSVIHGKEAILNPAPRNTKVVDALPRVFSQTFICSPDIGPDTKPEDYPTVTDFVIISDHMRFVG